MQPKWKVVLISTLKHAAIVAIPIALAWGAIAANWVKVGVNADYAVYIVIAVAAISAVWKSITEKKA